MNLIKMINFKKTLTEVFYGTYSVKLNEFKQELLFNFRLMLSGGLLSIIDFRLFWFSPSKGERRGSSWFLSYFY